MTDDLSLFFAQLPLPDLTITTSTKPNHKPKNKNMEIMCSFSNVFVEKTMEYIYIYMKTQLIDQHFCRNETSPPPMLWPWRSSLPGLGTPNGGFGSGNFPPKNNRKNSGLGR